MHMEKSFSHRFQILRQTPEPLGLFFRPGRADHTVINQLVSENRTGMAGVVFDPCHLSFQESLRAELWTRELYTVLDPLCMELSTHGGFTPARAKLPWGGDEVHSPSVLSGKAIDRMAAQIADCAAKHDFNAVLAPTHFLQDGVNDSWFLIDRRLVTQLRQKLDDLGRQATGIYYPLATSTKLFFDHPQRAKLRSVLSGLPIDGIWLRIHPIGSWSGDNVLRRYIVACQDFHLLGKPLIAERNGALGLPLLAFGAVSGLDSGITSGEQFNFARLKKVPKKRPVFAARPRVYVGALGAFLQRNDAIEFFTDPRLRQYGCRDTACCQRGFESMTKDPRRHFAFARMEEVALLSGTPEMLRPASYLQRILGPADQNLTRVLSSAGVNNSIKAALERRQRRIRGWIGTLTRLKEESGVLTFCPPLKRQIVHVRATA
jgi:hypothetical protein